MLSILGEFATMLFVSAFGGKTARREMSDALQANNRQLGALNAHYAASATCFDLKMAEWNDVLYPGYRGELNKQRAFAGLRPI